MQHASFGLGRWAVVTYLFIFVGAAAFAQTGPGTLRGQITDPSGAVVSQATVTATSAHGTAVRAVSDRQGIYEFKQLAPGSYLVSASAKGFAVFAQQDVVIGTGRVRQFDIALEIAVQQEQVNVQDQTTAVDVAPMNNASSIVIKGKDLDALSDDPDELMDDLQALAGPSAGPNGGQIYIDGFSNGQLPPKSAIREIRINQNPFSAEYDKLGYGRIEIFTKPGTDQFHGQFSFMGNNSVLNSRNPFVATMPDYNSEMFSGNVSGPLSKKASFFFNAERRNIDEAAVVNAFILDSSLNQAPFSQAILTPRTRTSVTPRLDYQLTPNNTLTVRYSYTKTGQENAGVGQFALPSQAYTVDDSEQRLQISDTQVLSARTVNETRFQYVRDQNRSTSIDFSPTVNVLSSFTSGGNRLGLLADHTDHYEAQNYTSVALGKHLVKFGGRLRASREVNDSTANYNGTFTFASLHAYQIMQQGLAQGWSAAQILAAGGGASQFSITTGQPLAEVTWADAGLYAQDDWRIRPNLTLSYGLRFETQNAIHDHADFAPRVGIAWGLGRAKTTPKTVLRAGFGMFYDRFGQDLVMQAERLNGVHQQQITVTTPDFFPSAIPPLASLTGVQTLPTVYQIDPNLRAPYTIQSAVTLERQLTRTATVSATYLHSHGERALLVRNINAPLPETGVRPLGNIGNVYQYESDGAFNQNQFIVNANIRAGSKVSLFGYYTLNYANSNTAGASSFPSNQYDLAADYGRAAFDIRHRVFFGGSISLPYGVRLNPFVVANSGAPFNITMGRDVNGDSIFNDRPAFATDLSRASVVVTRWGAFDTQPIAGQTVIPINYGNGPAEFAFNLRVSKTIGLGKKLERTARDGSPEAGGGRERAGRGAGGPGGRGGAGGPGGAFGPRGMGPGGMGGDRSDHRYNLTLSASARNLFNRVNLAPPVGNLDSRFFGESVALAGGPFGSSSANRRIELQAMFSF